MNISFLTVVNASESKYGIPEGYLSMFDESGGSVESSGEKDGMWRYYDKGVLRVRGEYDSGLKVGVWVAYETDGSVEKISRYTNGKLDGISLGFHQNGEVSYDAFFVDGILSGRLVAYSNLGIPVVKISDHDKKGKIDGMVTHYAPNGDVYSSAVYDSGVVVEWIVQPEENNAEK